MHNMYFVMRKKNFWYLFTGIRKKCFLTGWLQFLHPFLGGASQLHDGIELIQQKDAEHVVPQPYVPII